MKNFLEVLKKKLSSRKVWMTVITFIGMVVVFLNAANLGTEKLIAVLTSFAVLVVYIIGECIADAKNKTLNLTPEEDTINWKRKFGSRKFWAAIISFITTLLITLGVSEITVEQISAIIVAISSVSVYILGESVVDGAPVDDYITLDAEKIPGLLEDLGFDSETAKDAVENVEKTEDRTKS